MTSMNCPFPVQYVQPSAHCRSRSSTFILEDDQERKSIVKFSRPAAIVSCHGRFFYTAIASKKSRVEATIISKIPLRGERSGVVFHAISFPDESPPTTMNWITAVDGMAVVGISFQPAVNCWPGIHRQRCRQIEGFPDDLGIIGIGLCLIQEDIQYKPDTLHFKVHCLSSDGGADSF